MHALIMPPSPFFLRAWCDRAKKLEIQAAPLQQSERQNSAAAAALASEKESLKKEVESWKKRVTSLTASFNAVRQVR